MSEEILEKKKEKELHSKICVAKCIYFVNSATKIKDEDEIHKLKTIDKFSSSIATILVRNKEVVAVNMTVMPNCCNIYISKNDKWLESDIEYTNDIQLYLK